MFTKKELRNIRHALIHYEELKRQVALIGNKEIAQRYIEHANRLNVLVEKVRALEAKTE